jgi:hypothetical protein
VKSILVDFLKRNYLSLPSEELLVPSSSAVVVGEPVGPSVSQQDHEYTLFDRLFFLAIILCSVFPGPLSLPFLSSSTDSRANPPPDTLVPPTSLQNSKPQYLLSVALQALVDLPLPPHPPLLTSSLSSDGGQAPLDVLFLF